MAKFAQRIDFSGEYPVVHTTVEGLNPFVVRLVTSSDRRRVKRGLRMMREAFARG